MRLRGYYAILDVAPAALVDGGGAGAQLEARAARLLAGRPCCLQLRAKGAEAGLLRAAAARVLEACRRAGVPFCVNDRLDVALAVGAEAVHLGQEDLPLADARRARERAGAAGLAIGFSTHDRAQALAAAADGADYLAFGPVFATASKANPDRTVGLQLLAEVCRSVSVPVVAIGGITPETAAAVAGAGAAAAAVIAAVDRAADPGAAGLLIGAAFEAPIFS
jgi:thiamine-phosphate pyrophosphorylase